MPLEFGNDVCAPCESSARIWHKGKDPIGRRPIAILVVDVNLQYHQFVRQIPFDAFHSQFELQ